MGSYPIKESFFYSLVVMGGPAQFQIHWIISRFTTEVGNLKHNYLSLSILHSLSTLINLTSLPHPQSQNRELVKIAEKESQRIPSLHHRNYQLTNSTNYHPLP